MATIQYSSPVAAIAHSGFFVLRTPLLPIEEFLRWSNSIHSLDAGNCTEAATSTEKGWLACVEELRARLIEIVERPEVRQALFIASPSLEASIEHWAQDPDSKKGLQTERSLVRYFARMCGRSMPFGLFSGCSVGRIGSADDLAESELSLEPCCLYKPISRLDFGYLSSLTAGLRADPAIAGELHYWPNSSLRKIGDVWHYVESRAVGSNRSHHLVKLYNDQYLNSVLAAAHSGLTIPELVDTICVQYRESSNITEAEANTFIQELIDSEVLVSNLSPQVTGNSPLDDIIAQTATLPSGSRAAQTLQWAKDALAALDKAGLGTPPADYCSIASRLASLPAKVDITRLFQVDMTKPVRRLHLAESVAKELVGAIELLRRVGWASEPDELRGFRDAFVERYEHAWIPLLEALDEEVGLGFGNFSRNESSPLLRGIQIGGEAESAAKIAQQFHALLSRRVLESHLSRVEEIVLDLAELPHGEGQIPNLPDSFALTATLVADSGEAVQRGDYRISIGGAHGPSGARLLGRFCHTDAELEKLVRQHLCQEEALEPAAAYAEIVYLPEGSIGNVLCRPVLRDYELVYLGRSGAEPRRQLPLSDLLVSVSVEGIILLYSKRLRRRIIPRLTNAHGFLNPTLPSVYRFLCYLQHQHGAYVPMPNWGSLDSLNQLPRIRVGRVVLVSARWRLSADEVDALRIEGRHQCFLAVQRLRQQRGLPRMVLFVEGDQALPIDLDNPLSVDSFVHILKRAETATLQEMYPAPNELCVTGPEGRFYHELLVPFIRQTDPEESPVQTQQKASRSAAIAPIDIASVDRTLPPGSDWLYIKLYGAPSALDDVLAKELPSMLRTAFAWKLVKRWFFLRYSDPHQHLRIRFQGRSSALTQELLPLALQAFNPLLQSRKLWKLQLDTYEREVERYGGVEGVCAAEEFFFADSEAVLEVLQASSDDEGLHDRWRIAFLGVDCLLYDCGLDVPDRLSLVGKMRNNLRREFNTGAKAKKQLGDRFRSLRKDLEAILAGSSNGNTSIDAARKVFTIRSARFGATMQRLQSLREEGSLKVNFDDLLASYVHLHVNRMIRSDQKAHELVLYDFLYRAYESTLARK